MATFFFYGKFHLPYRKTSSNIPSCPDSELSKHSEHMSCLFLNRDILVSLASKFHCSSLELGSSVCCLKDSSQELDHLACFAGSYVVLDHHGELSWDQRM
jgi:hypothetical protein